MPFHQRIYTLSGYEEMWKDYGEDYSYELCPRAKIFRRDQASVIDLPSLKHIMRSNGTLSVCLCFCRSCSLVRRLYDFRIYLYISLCVCTSCSLSVYVVHLFVSYTVSSLSRCEITFSAFYIHTEAFKIFY